MGLMLKCQYHTDLLIYLHWLIESNSLWKVTGRWLLNAGVMYPFVQGAYLLKVHTAFIKYIRYYARSHCLDESMY